SPSFGFDLRNDTGATITQFTLSYRGEQWRQNAAGSLTVSYFIDTVLSGPDLFIAGPAAAQLNFAAPKTGVAGALNGNAAGDFTNVSATVGGLFRGDGTALTAIAAQSQAAPGGGTFISFGSPAMNPAGQVAFFASTSTTAGVFRGDGTTAVSIARAGAAAPGGSTFSTFFNPS